MILKEEGKIVAGCKSHKPKWQKTLFDQTVDYMRATCFRYSSSTDETDDILQEGYIKVFDNIGELDWKGDGALFFWVKRIMVNTAIDFYRKQKRHIDDSTELENILEETDEEQGYSDSDFSKEEISMHAILASDLSESELICAVQKLPQPFRTTFNLFAIEGIKHKDIAEIQDISIKTSTTRVLRAKKMLQEIIAEMCANKIVSIA